MPDVKVCNWCRHEFKPQHELQDCCSYLCDLRSSGQSYTHSLFERTGYVIYGGNPNPPR